MNEKESRMQTAINELDAFIMENNLSYYEVAAYAYNNDQHDWLEVFRSKKYNAFIHGICKRAKYNKPYEEAYNEYLAAQADYTKRHTTNQGTWKD